MSLTKREGAIISAYTGYMCGNFADMHEYAEELFGHPIFTHQFGSQTMADELRDKAKPDFLQLCSEIQ